MTATHRTLVLGLAVLLAAAMAVADTVITAEEVISCRWVESAGPDSIRFTPPGLRTGVLSTRDICEIRLSDSSRVAELAAQLPGVRVILDSGQPIPPPAVRAEQLRQERAHEARAEDLPEYAVVVETLAHNASPAKMAARCRDMDAVLRECGRGDDTVVELLREIDREEAALRRIWPEAGTYLLSGTCCGLLGMTAGTALEPDRKASRPRK
jgi:hypothetical protein